MIDAWIQTASAQGNRQRRGHVVEHRSDTDMGLATANDRAEPEWDIPDVRGE